MLFAKLRSPKIVVREDTPEVKSITSASSSFQQQQSYCDLKADCVPKSELPTEHPKQQGNTSVQKITLLHLAIGWLAGVMLCLAGVYVARVRLNYDFAVTLRLWLTLLLCPPMLYLAIVCVKRKPWLLVFLAIAVVSIHLLGIGIVNNNPGIGSDF